jgi:hypothetical protein
VFFIIRRRRCAQCVPQEFTHVEQASCIALSEFLGELRRGEFA